MVLVVSFLWPAHPKGVARHHQKYLSGQIQHMSVPNEGSKGYARGLGCSSSLETSGSPTYFGGKPRSDVL